jgi:hypothetical protein
VFHNLENYFDYDEACFMIVVWEKTEEK